MFCPDPTGRRGPLYYFTTLLLYDLPPVDILDHDVQPELIVLTLNVLYVVCYSIYKGDINFEVAPDLGMNASTISKQASK